MVANGPASLVHRPSPAAEHERQQRWRHKRIPTPSPTPRKEDHISLPLVHSRTHDNTYTVLHEPQASTGRLLHHYPPQEGHIHPEHQLRGLSIRPHSLRNARDSHRSYQEPSPHKHHGSRANPAEDHHLEPHSAYQKHPRPNICTAPH